MWCTFVPYLIFTADASNAMISVHPPARSFRPVLAGLVGGLLIGAAPFAYDLPVADQILFGLGLFLTYTSIGVLVALLPRIGSRWLFGLLLGALYSLPGSVLVAVPYPLRPDAHEFYRNFAAGGMEEFVMTMIYGMAVGLVCGLVLPKGGGETRSAG